MATPNFVLDKDVLWLEVPRSGTPSEWLPNTNYKLGDVVIPRASYIIPSGKETVMFQCVGFLGKSDIVPPTFPTVVGNTIIDNNIRWICRDPNETAVNIDWFEYYQTVHTLTLT